MGVTDRSRAKKLHDEKQKFEMSEFGKEVAQAFQDEMDRFHKMDMRDDNEIEIEFLKDQMRQINGKAKLRGTFDDSLPRFSPSGASKCERELGFKLMDAPQDDKEIHAYHTRWTRNAKAVHSAFQKDLLYMEQMEGAKFKVMRTQQGYYAWERNIRTVKTFEHDGETFQLYGMGDGIVKYKDTVIGIDLKTKSTTIAMVGDYKLKEPPQNNFQQMVGYSLLFGIDHFLIPYESLAKDGWTKGAEARNDMKVFCVEITEKDRKDLLDKFARVVKAHKKKAVLAPDFSKCLFCPYQTVCAELERELHGKQ